MTLLTLDAECPTCGRRPNVRVLPSLVDLVADVDPSHPLGTWHCQGRDCTSSVRITAGMIQAASTEPLTSDGPRA